MKNILSVIMITMLAGCSAIDWKDQTENTKQENKNVVLETKELNTEKENYTINKGYTIPNKYALVNTSWKLEYINDHKVIDEDITLHFKNNLFSEHDLLINGFSGCNSYQITGSVDHVLELLKTDRDVLATNFDCIPEKIELERIFLNYLVNNKKIEQIDVNTLKLGHYNNHIILKRDR